MIRRGGSGAPHRVLKLPRGHLLVYLGAHRRGKNEEKYSELWLYWLDC